jgi:UDP-N-acetylmuramate: L-alanyl-gamma-D-glutamyl-meso-diaminopimelate ligase
LQVSQAEILDRVIRAGFDAQAISNPDEALQTIGSALQPDDAILLLTSGNLGGLIDRIPVAAEQRYPR